MAKRSAAVMVDEPTLGIDASSNPASWLAYNTPSWITEAQAADPAPAAQPSLAVAPAAPDVAPAAPSLAVEPLRNYWGGIVEDTSPTRNFVTNKGNEAGSVTADPNSTYRILNNAAGGAEVYQGKGLEGLNNTYEIASDLSKHAGKTAGWSVQVQDPSTGEWSTVAQDDPAKPGFLGKAAMALGPVAGGVLGAVLAPATGGLSLLLPALGAGLGAAGGNLAAGKGLADSVLNGGLTGMAALATGGALKGFPGATPAGGGISFVDGAAALPEAASSGAGSALGSVASDVGGDILINGSRGLSAAAGGALMGGAGALPGIANMGGNVAPDAQQPVEQADGNGITVTATPPAPLSVSPGDIAAAAGAGALNPGLSDAANKAGDVTLEGRKPDPPIELTVPPLPPLNVDTSGLVDNALIDKELAAPEEKKGMSYDQIMKLLGLVASGAGLLGNAVGGKGKSSQGTIPAGFGTGPASIPGFGVSLNDAIAALPAGTARQPRVMPQQDWQRYATRPEQSFFTNIPQTYTPPLPGEEDQWTGKTRGYARGGGVEGQSLAVRGPGTDRSDSIPAYLSDGEYVIDAPTVRKIGRGSTERGFDRLDDLRVTVHGGKPHRALKSVGAR